MNLKLVFFLLGLLVLDVHAQSEGLCAKGFGRLIDYCSREAFAEALAAAKPGGGGGGGCTCPTFEESVLCPWVNATRNFGEVLIYVEDGYGGGCYDSQTVAQVASEWANMTLCNTRVDFTPVFLGGTGSLVTAVHYASYQLCGNHVEFDINLRVSLQIGSATQVIIQTPVGKAAPLPPTTGSNQEVAIGHGVGMSSDGQGGFLEAKSTLLLLSVCQTSGNVPINADRFVMAAQDGGTTNQDVALAVTGNYKLLGSTLCA